MSWGLFIINLIWVAFARVINITVFVLFAPFMATRELFWPTCACVYSKRLDRQLHGYLAASHLAQRKAWQYVENVTENQRKVIFLVGTKIPFLDQTRIPRCEHDEQLDTGDLDL